jgi:16S rRNA (guanine966-N2)-methyltransferase
MRQELQQVDSFSRGPRRVLTVRIGAGSARGRTLAGPKDARRIRPTADRVRQTVFNVLGQFFEGESVLDLYAGTGAFGLEALSRGAGFATLVDQDREALELCRANAASLGFEPRVRIIGSPVGEALAQLGREGVRFQLVFADPPYAAEVAGPLLDQLSAARILDERGTFLVEHDKREDSPLQQGGLTRFDQRRFGDTVVSFYARTSTDCSV